jgi:iron complex outermembrane receptor protein
LTATRDESTRPICGFAALLVLQLLTSLSASIANAAEGIEQITVYSPPSERFAFNSVKIEFDSAPFPPNNIRELISRIPGVDANGQGGDFQTFSIRGVSRQRIQTRIGDAPIISERRAGASVSFVDPTLLDSAEVVRGPASTLFGSGALGGAVLLEPARYDGFAGNFS